MSHLDTGNTQFFSVGVKHEKKIHIQHPENQSEDKKKKSFLSTGVLMFSSTLDRSLDQSWICFSPKFQEEGQITQLNTLLCSSKMI